MVVAGVVAAWLLSKRAAAVAVAPSDAHLANPFSLREALSFGALYALILLGARAAQEYLGTQGMYLAAAVSGVVDVDAVTIAFTRLGAASDGWQAPAAAVTIAVVTNTLVKLGIALAAGGSGFRQSVTIALGVMAIVGAVAGASVFVHL
jgi:uncharacterized membrane protein (DUF4010 family)